MNYQGLDALQDQGEICKHYRICRTRVRSVIATGVSQIEQLRISGYLNMRRFLSFDRKSLLRNHRCYAGAWQILCVLAWTREQKENPGKDWKAASDQGTFEKLMNSRSEALKGMNILKLIKFFISLGSEYSFFLLYIIETIKTAPMEMEDSSEKLISSLSIIFLNAAS